VRALLFDVFGTCVDWRSGIVDEVEAVARRHDLEIDGGTFADAWRERYQPSLEEVRSGRRPFDILDILHRESLDAIIPVFGLDSLDDTERWELTLAWHRLDPWPDVVPGLAELKEHFVIAPFSNGNVSLLVDMAKRTGLPWDLVLCAETSGAYKPQPESYLNAVAMLGLDARDVTMVAAHPDDLRAARAAGLRTAYVPRPLEHGPGRSSEPDGADDWDVVAGDFGALASAVGSVSAGATP
jgi:2-haloacid dehalogenase